MSKLAATLLHTYIGHVDRTTNLLGALSLAIADRVRSGLKETFNRSGEASAAIVVLGYAPGLSVEPLRQVLGLTHAGTVRLIDRLAADGLVERREAEDRRAIALHLTEKGSRLRQKLMDRRLEILEGMLTEFTTDERLTLGRLIAKLLTGLPESEMAKHRICRLCAAAVCEDCPIPGSAI